MRKIILNVIAVLFVFSFAFANTNETNNYTTLKNYTIKNQNKIYEDDF